MSIQDTSPQRYPVGSSSLEAVRTRIHYKMRDYATYRFTAPQSCAINIFFDLAQEFQELEQVHSLDVLILNMFFQYDTELYLKDNKGQLLLTTPAVNPEIVGLPELRPEIWNDSARCYVPVRGREALVGKDPRMAGEDGLMGVLVLYVSKVFESHDLLFLQKFANRLGFCLHNKVLSERNARHVLFLRKLAHDIGHNVITPNMRLKLMLNHLGKQMEHIESLSQGAPDEVSMHDIRVLQHSMQEQLKQVQADFNNGALFLESLLRQSHFDLGRYVLRLAPLDIKSMVALQFDRFRMTFEERRLAVRHEEPVMPEPPCMVEADLGLISQALTNLLSNAAKYATPEPDAERGEVRCRVEIVPGAFDQDRDGIKITVFSTGGHIDPAERDRLFEDCYRASNTAGQFGTGHGLFFVRQIVSEHKGDSGYEPVPGGNEFYFILPRLV